MIKFVSDLRQVGCFLRFPPPIKLTAHNIAEILLKVALSTIKPTKLSEEATKISFEVLMFDGELWNHTFILLVIQYDFLN